MPICYLVIFQKKYFLNFARTRLFIFTIYSLPAWLTRKFYTRFETDVHLVWKSCIMSRISSWQKLHLETQVSPQLLIERIQVFVKGHKLEAICVYFQVNWPLKNSLYKHVQANQCQLSKKCRSILPNFSKRHKRRSDTYIAASL